MSAATVSVTRKNAAGDLISIGGTDAADFLSNAAILLGDDGLEAVKEEIAAVFTPAAAGGSIQQATNVVTAAFPQATPAAASDVPTCLHGPRTWKEGVSKAGKPYKLWACPSGNRSDQCAPAWA